MFRLTESEIKELVPENGVLEIESQIKLESFNYLKTLTTKDLDGLYMVLSRQNLDGKNLEIRNEIEKIVEKRVVEISQYENIRN